MAEKVTMRFEQFSDEDSNLISYQGPIAIYKTVEDEAQLYGLTAIEGDPYYNITYFDSEFPEVPLNDDNSYDYENAPSVVVFVKNVTSYPESIRRRGAYFRYNYINDSWQEIAIGSHSHENKELLDKMSAGDIGTWFNLTNYPNAEESILTIGTTAPETPADNYLFFNTDINKLFKYRYSTVTWIELDVVIGTIPPIHPSVKDMFFNSDTQELFIFTAAKIGDKRILILEVTDPDNSDMTYSYDIAWTTMPESIPEVPEDDVDKEKLYLGVDSLGTIQWKNSLIAGQTFEVRNITIEDSDTNELTIVGIKYDSNLDEVLVIDNSLFLANRDITYDEETETMTILANEGTEQNPIFIVGERIVVLVIRNGASAVLDELATDYLTKAEAINLLSGGSITLKGYATTADLQGRALRDHTHSQFARTEHDHDFRYANYVHTHDNYLTRRKVLELIEETVAMHPDILNILQSFSDYLNDVGTNPELTDLLASMATQTNITTIQNQIDAINANFYNKTQLYSYLRNEATFRTDQINTTFLDDSFTPRNLQDVLNELKEKIDTDLDLVNSTNVLLEETIEAELGDDGYVGGINTSDSLLAGETLQSILTKLIRRRIVPEYKKAELITTFDVNPYPEIGSTIPLKVTAIYEIHDSGAITQYRLLKQENGSTVPLYEGPSIVEVNENITIGTSPVSLSTYATYATGPTKYDNFGDPVSGKIEAGSTEILSVLLEPVRAIFYGGSTEILNINTLESDDVRSYFAIKTQPDYDEINIEITIPIGTMTILFALPAVDGLLTAIEHKEEGYSNIINVFSETTINIEAGNGLSPIPYNVYMYKMPFALSNSMHLRFIK